MPRLSEAQRNQAIGMLRAGTTPVAVSRFFGCTRATIFALSGVCSRHGTVIDRRRTGRPRATTLRDDRAIHFYVRGFCLRQSRHVGIYTFLGRRIRNRLRPQALPVRAYRPYTGSIITHRHRRARLQWARRHRHWRRRDWNTMLFSDESRFNLNHASDRQRAYRRKVKRRHGPGILQQDNARPHTAILTRNHLAANVDVLPWPAVSPDLNPIEHIWDEIGRRVRERYALHNVDQLSNYLVREWNSLEFQNGS